MQRLRRQLGKLALVASSAWLLAAPAQAENAYYEAARALPSPALRGGCARIEDPGWIADAHHDLTSRLSWAIPTDEAIDAIADFAWSEWHGRSLVVDFGAGSGYWAHLLAQRGADVLALDDWSWGKPMHLWHPVETGSFERLAGTRERALLLVWPPKNSTMASRALVAWGGKRLVFVGDVLRRTADADFFRLLGEEWRLVRRISIPQWHNRSDAVWLLERAPGAGSGSEWMRAEVARACGVHFEPAAFARLLTMGGW